MGNKRKGTISTLEIEELYRKVGLNPNPSHKHIRTTINTGTLENKLVTNIPDRVYSGKQTILA